MEAVLPMVASRGEEMGEPPVENNFVGHQIQGKQPKTGVEQDFLQENAMVVQRSSGLRKRSWGTLLTFSATGRLYHLSCGDG